MGRDKASRKNAKRHRVDLLVVKSTCVPNNHHNPNEEHVLLTAAAAAAAAESDNCAADCAILDTMDDSTSNNNEDRQHWFNERSAITTTVSCFDPLDSNHVTSCRGHNNNQSMMIHQEEGRLSVRSSWISSSLQPMNKKSSGYFLAEQQLHDPVQQMILPPDGVDETEDTTTVTYRDEDDDDDQDDEFGNSMSYSKLIRTEIHCLSKQLLQAKRRLLPAAEQCAERANHLCCLGHDSSHNRRSRVSARDMFTLARSMCNPFEVLGERRNGGLAERCMFMNRAAIKLANMDALLNFELATRATTRTPPTTTTNTTTTNTTSSSSSHNYDPFVFVDLCGAPGGFSEYIMMRRRQLAKKERQSQGSSSSLGCATSSCYGYGMSLIGSNEYGHGTPWHFNDTTRSSSSNNRGHDDDDTDPYHHHEEQYEVFGGVDGTGDIFVWDNVQALCDRLKEDHAKRQSCGNSWYSDSSSSHRGTVAVTDSDSVVGNRHNVDNNEDDDDANDNDDEPYKADLVLADGGFDAQRDSDDQEGLTQKLIVCQVAAALTLLRRGGRLVLKMFGFQTPVIRSLLADVQKKFLQPLLALKPISSRPASAERYLICRGFRGGVVIQSPCNNFPKTTTTTTGWISGPAWRNQMFLAKLPEDEDEDDSMTTTTTTTTTARNWDDFWLYIDAFDRDLLFLNLKSCFSILTHLDNNYQRRQEHHQEHHQQQQRESTTTTTSNERPTDCRDYDTWHSASSRVDVLAYKRAWRL